MPSPQVYYPITGTVQAELIVNCIVVFLVLTIVALRVTGRLLGPGVVMLICQGVFAPVGNGYNLPEHPERKLSIQITVNNVELSLGSFDRVALSPRVPFLAANIPFILQLTFGMQLIYTVLLAAVKASMLCFYLRVFVTPFMQMASKIMLGFLMAWMLSFVFACTFLCTPVSGQWTGVGKCGQYIPLIQALIATNAIGDLVIMLLPMPSIWSLQMRKTDKLGVTSCFALALAYDPHFSIPEKAQLIIPNSCIVCAGFRLYYISAVDLTGNVTGTMATTVFLFTLEPNLAILCVSIPMLRPFYSMYKKRMGGSRLQESGSGRPSRYIISEDLEGKSRLAAGSADGAPTTWEMDDYYGHDGTSHDAIVESYGDRTQSNDSSVPPTKKPNIRIGVEKKWSVTRN
ncbi:hypothetical protein FQN53_006873 [Emmonsiellopsis sp. PD_33]|nr:hypothetical protein FQN53_006873 [Emmonsiellopsis sp. PD_33]